MLAGLTAAKSSIFRLNQRDVHIAVWLILLSHILISRIAPIPSEEWYGVVLNTSLLVVIAFMVIFHLLTDHTQSEHVENSDYWILMGVVVSLALSSNLGSPYDVPLIMGLVSMYYFSKYTTVRDSFFIGIVYLALAFNGFLAPLIFHLIKDVVLIGEVHAAAILNNLIGLEVAANGTRLTSEGGMRLQMVGGCSVYSNLSLAILGYASVKAFFRQKMVAADVLLLLALAMCLVLVNSVRLGLMTPDLTAYRYWHHGDGSMLVAVVQTALILLVCASVAILSGPPKCQN